MLTEAEAQRLPVTMVPVKQARFDPRAQSRAGMVREWVGDFREWLREGRDLEPGVFFREGASAAAVYWCASGFHRGAAYVEEGHAYLPGRVVPGTLRDAILFSAASNKLPGCLRRTNADKRRAVSLLLEDAEWRGWKDLQIADHCGVSRHLVSTMREEARERARKAKAPPPPEEPDEEGGSMSAGQAAPPEPAPVADDETVERRLAQLPRSSGRLVQLCARLEKLRPGLGRLAAELEGLPESLRRAAMKVVAQCEEASADPHWWVDDAVRRRAERGRRR